MLPRPDAALGGQAEGGESAFVTRPRGTRGQSVDGSGAQGAPVVDAIRVAVPDGGVDGGSVPVVVLAAASASVAPTGVAPVPPPASGLVAPAASAPIVSAADGLATGRLAAACVVGRSAAAAAAAPVAVSAHAGAGASVPAETFHDLSLDGEASAYVIEILEVRLAEFSESMAKTTWPRGDADVRLHLACLRAEGVDWTRGLVTVDGRMEVVDGVHLLAALLLLESEGHVNAIDRFPVRRITRRDGKPLTLVDTTVVTSGHYYSR